MKGTFNQGWWNCFETFAGELLKNDNGENFNLCTEVLRGAGISGREARAWLDKPVERKPEVEEVVREYFLEYCN